MLPRNLTPPRTAQQCAAQPPSPQRLGSASQTQPHIPTSTRYDEQLYSNPASTAASPSQSHCSTKRQRNSPKQPRKRKQKADDEISTLVMQYLRDTDPSLWSLKHLKSCIGPKHPGKQKWQLKIELEEMSRTASSSAQGIAARRVLRQLDPRKKFSTPVATFGINSDPSTVIYAQNSTLNTSGTGSVFSTNVCATTPASSAAAAAAVTPQTFTASDASSTLAKGSVTPARRNSPTLAESPAQSQSSQADYGPSQIVHFFDIYPTLQTKFTLYTKKRSTTLEDLLHTYLQDPKNSALVEGNLLLESGFIDIVSRPPSLLSSHEFDIVKTSLRSKDSHVVAACVKKCFSNCQSYESFIEARNTFSCEYCKYNPLFQQGTSAVLYTVHFLLNSTLISTLPLEGNFDVIWANIIDHAFISPYGFLHRKEKSSSLSPNKFDGLFIGGCVDPQEWLVIEVARASGQGLKQTNDRQRLIEHCLRILNYRRWYLGIRTNLRGQQLVTWLAKFPMWGVLCQGFSIEVIKMGWLTRGVGVVTTFASRFPEHMIRMDSLYRILEEVQYAAQSVRECVRDWDELHGQMAGNRVT